MRPSFVVGVLLSSSKSTFIAIDFFVVLAQVAKTAVT